MNIREKILVYPFDGRFNPILRYKEMLSTNMEFIGLISPRAWGLCGKDAGEADNGQTIDILVSADYDEMLDLCDTVWFYETDIPLDFESSIYPKIVTAIKSGKNIISTICLNDKKNGLIELCSKQNVKFMDLNDLHTINNLEMASYKLMNNFNVPIITVASLSKDCGKFETQLSLRDNFIKMGYKVSQIGSRKGCEIMGFHSFPDFMFDENIKDNHKIIYFNNFVKKIEKDEKPDLIILGVPGGIMPVCNEDYDNFGVTAYQISQALTPDVSILNILYDRGLGVEYFEKMYNTFKYRFGYEIKCFNLFNKSIDWDAVTNDKRISYCSISKRNIEELKENLVKTYDLQVYSLNSKSEAENLTNYLVDTLATYAEVSTTI